MAQEANRVRIGKALRQGRSHNAKFNEPKDAILKTPSPKDTKKDEPLKVDKTTAIAFGVLFVLPILIILLSLLFLFPYMMRMIERPDDSGTITNSGSNASQLPPSR